MKEKFNLSNATSLERSAMQQIKGGRQASYTDPCGDYFCSGAGANITNHVQVKRDWKPQQPHEEVQC